MCVCVLGAVLSCVEDVEGDEGAPGGARGGGTRLAKRYVGLYTGPYFDPTAPNNITAQLGTHAYLPCKVRFLQSNVTTIIFVRRLQ